MFGSKPATKYVSGLLERPQITIIPAYGSEKNGSDPTNHMCLQQKWVTPPNNHCSKGKNKSPGPPGMPKRALDGLFHGKSEL